MQEQLERDLKTAMLAGDKVKTETLRGLKSAILNETISAGARESGLSDEQIQKVLAREAKKRTDAIELYEQAGETTRAAAEKSEKAVIEQYLPAQLSQEELSAAINTEISKLDSPSPADMGKIIGAVKAKLGAQADGATIARLVKEALGK